jgi:hypothetical protein
LAFSFLQKNDGSCLDTLLTAHVERAIIITVRHDGPLTSQSATAGGYDNTFAVALLLACLEGKIRLLPFATVINVGCKSFSPVSDFKMVRIMRCTIYRNGVFSLHFYFLLRKRELLAGHGRLSFVLYIYFSLKKGLTRTLMWVYNTCAIKKRRPRRRSKL